jgi:hypothetical protein
MTEYLIIGVLVVLGLPAIGMIVARFIEMFGY